MSKQISLRDKKKAIIKLNILNATIELIGNGFINDIQLSDICDKADISKVTFFKYFPRKESIIDYFFRIWNFHLEVDQLRHPKRGLERIEYLFQKVCQTKNANNIMLNLISYIASLKKPIAPIEITKAEKIILYPEQEDVLNITVPDLRDIFIRCLDEALQDGEISSNFNPDTIVKALASTFYGIPIVSHIRQENDLWKLYKEKLNLLFCGLKD
jgi:AcrR family transcriptional regulator